MKPDNLVVVAIRVQTRGSRSEIQGVKNGRLRIKTTSPPADGKANRDVIRQLARAFGVPPSRVILKSGAAQRNKMLVISDPVDLPEWVRDVCPKFQD